MNEIKKVDTDLLIPEEDRNIIDVLISSKALPAQVTNRAIAFTMIQFGKELNLKPLQSLHYIIMISGKMALTTMAVGSLLRTNGIDYELKKDGVYLYADGSTSFNHYDTDKAKGDPIDRITEYVFYYKSVTGKIIEQTVSFTFTEAEAANLIDNPSKPNWKLYRRDMMRARCLSRGARIVAPHILMGMYTDAELSDELNDSSVMDAEVVDD